MQRVDSVLLIDDDPIFNMINKKIIQVAKFAARVTSHVNAHEALVELRQFINANSPEFPNVIFLDINMPQMDGWEFLEEFGKLPESYKRACNIYMLTSSIDPSDIQKSEKYRILKDFISKPLTTDKLEMLHLSTPPPSVIKFES